MANKRNETKKSKRSVKQKKKKVPVVPCLQLEPRLTPSPSKKKRCSKVQVDEKDSMCYNDELQGEVSFDQESAKLSDTNPKETVKTEVEESSIHEVPYLKPKSPNKNATNHEVSYLRARSPRIIGQRISPEKPKNKQRKRGLKGFQWNNRERLDLATSLQADGFSDMQKIAESVKTKNETAIREFIKWRRIACQKTSVKIQNRQGDYWNTLRPEFVKSWPNIRKWRKLAYDQMLLYTRTKDYSKQVIPALCKKFYEEEKEPTNSQVINVKLIYKYMIDCMSGVIPPQLPPKESALVLDLLREVRSVPTAYDLDEEKKFLQDFRSSTKFKPFHVKDEFKKRFKKETVSDDEETKISVSARVFTPNTVAVPEEVFLDLSRHKRLTQSFSPLVTPVWMLQKEQELLAKKATE